ncbi:Acyl-CoA synthetase family member 2 [Sarcoptes scabiei]|nr:Acyl-CoA synthetase family member 2 [Sarcoptes scabiei]
MSTKILRIEKFLNLKPSIWLCGRQSTILQSLSSSPSPTSFAFKHNGSIFWQSQRNFNVNSFSDDFLEPFVDAPYSYAFGRSNNHIIHRTLGQILNERLDFDADKPVIISHHEKLTKSYAEFFDDVRQLSYALHNVLGLKRGDVVGLWSLNAYSWLLVQFACIRMGLILCTINPYYQTQELDYALRKGEIKALFMPGKNSKQNVVNRYSDIFLKTLNTEQKKQSDPSLRIHLENVIVLDGDGFDQGDLSASMSSIKFHHFDTLRKQKGKDVDQSLIESVIPDDPAVIMFTSGTTGKPKGACLSHSNIINNVSFTLRRYLYSMDSIVCVPLPFFHAFAGILGNLLIAISSIPLVIPCLKYDVRQLAEAIEQHQATDVMVTPTLAIDLLTYSKEEKLKLPSLKSVIAGGASVPVELTQQFVDYFPNCDRFQIGYGSTEISPCCSACSPLHSFGEATTTVAPIDFVEMKIVDPKTRQTVKLGETGEILNRGHNTMLGYWRDPEKTKEVIDDGRWYNTGDLGVMDEKGLIKIIGRTKELIIVGGENVYPREIEEILYTHPAIEIVNVIGIPDERKGEVVCAWVKLHHNAQCTEEELKEFCKDRITYFKVPKHFLFVDSFPMTATGKAQKFIMEKMTIEKLNLHKDKHYKA